MLKDTETKLKVKIINKSGNELPAYQTSGASGMDLRADIPQPLSLKPMERVLVPTGLFLSIPQGLEAQIRPRSGLALKQGITLVNSPGTIDEDYRGEIKVILINLSTENQTIQPADRIAQMVFARYEKIDWLEVDTLDETTRSAGGFGHTGN